MKTNKFSTIRIKIMELMKNLVGVTTMHCGPTPASASASIMRWMIGSRNAAVLPDPV